MVLCHDTHSFTTSPLSFYPSLESSGSNAGWIMQQLWGRRSPAINLIEDKLRHSLPAPTQHTHMQASMASHHTPYSCQKSLSQGSPNHCKFSPGPPLQPRPLPLPLLLSISQSSNMLSYPSSQCKDKEDSRQHSEKYQYFVVVKEGGDGKGNRRNIQWERKKTRKCDMAEAKYAHYF